MRDIRWEIFLQHRAETGFCHPSHSGIDPQLVQGHRNSDRPSLLSGHLAANNQELYEKECNGEAVVYWEVKYPFPMSNRDYVYVRQRRELDFEGKKVLVILAWSTSVLQFPEKSGVIRVKQYKQSLAIQSDGKKGSKVFMCYFDNPGGQIPSWLINWAAKSGVPNFLKDMSKACQNYRKKT